MRLHFVSAPQVVMTRHPAIAAEGGTELVKFDPLEYPAITIIKMLANKTGCFIDAIKWMKQTSEVT